MGDLPAFEYPVLSAIPILIILPMNIRNYNIYFNTHTISGIIICALLYVIFFAGSLSFFKKEITAWQHNTSYHKQEVAEQQYDQFLDSLASTTNLHGRDIALNFHQNGMKAYVSVSASHDTMLHAQNLAAKKANGTGKKERRGGRGGGDATYFGHDFVNNKSGDYASNYDLGEFLYRLHFLAQLNEVPIRLGFAPFGYVVAGITAFLFLFALITGLLLHWDKIKSNFFIFRPYNKWKTVWTDMHTALGVIGFPYQFLFAVTGVVLILNTLLVAPFAKVLYNNDTDKVYQDLGQSTAISMPYSYTPLDKKLSIGDYVNMAKEKWPDAYITAFNILNYGDANMLVILESEPHLNKQFAGSGILAIQARDNTIIREKSPNTDQTYVDSVRSLIYRLHFGDFGGYPVKSLYFILGIMGCLVIISGILIWLVARDKNNVLPRKRKFNFWTANVFLAICLSMFPVTALTFIAIKFAPEVNQTVIYKIYFNLWWVFSLYYIIRKNLNRTNRETLAIGSIAALAVSIANGIKTGSWFWTNFTYGKMDLFVVDFMWLFMGVIGLIALKNIKTYQLDKKKTVEIKKKEMISI